MNIKREEEIRKVSEEVFPTDKRMQNAWIKGAKWADENPNIALEIDDILKNPIYKAIYDLGREAGFRHYETECKRYKQGEA